MVGHIRREVIAGFVLVLDARDAVVDRGRPLVGLAADEAIELVEARARRPAIVRTGDRDFPGRRLVVLAEGGRAVAVHPQDLGQWRHAFGADAGIARKAGGEFHDRARIVDVVIAAGQERGTRRAAERGRVEPIVAQSLRGHFFQRRHMDRAAEGAAVAETDVVDQHDYDIRRALGRLDLEARRRLGVPCIELVDDSRRRFVDRQDAAVEAVRGLGGFRFFLCAGGGEQKCCHRQTEMENSAILHWHVPRVASLPRSALILVAQVCT